MALIGFSAQDSLSHTHTHTCFVSVLEQIEWSIKYDLFSHLVIDRDILDIIGHLWNYLYMNIQHLFAFFSRLWNHYSPNNKSTISYELFLEKLGFGASQNFKIAPVCTKLGTDTVD